MIRILTNIKSLSILQQNKVENIQSINKVSFEDESIGQGNFGSVHKVYSVCDRSTDEYVIKIVHDTTTNDHAYETLKYLHEKIKQRRKKLNTLPIFHEQPELLGLPFAIFKAWDDVLAKEVTAFLMYNLVDLGYEDYGADEVTNTGLKGHGIDGKFHLAYQFAKVVSFLNELKFTHSDFKADSIFINKKREQLVLIDFDSGYHFDKQAKPSTLGAITSWMPDFLRKAIREKFNITNIPVSERINSENWILANGIFEMIFDTPPFFFLTDSSESVRKAYYKKYDWPNIDYDDPNCNSSNKEVHTQLLSLLQIFEAQGLQNLIDTFKKTFNDGYQNSKHIVSASYWKNELQKINEQIEVKPTLSQFIADKASIKRKGESVTFKWTASRYNAIYINNQLQNIQATSTAIQLEDSKEVYIKLESDFGTVEKSIQIEAIKSIPVIHSFSASSLFRDNIDPIQLSWQTENTDYVTISTVAQQLDATGTIKVEPTSKTRYQLTAHGYFGEKITATLTVDILQPEIVRFRWEVNLEEGIKNIDLKWDTKHVQKVIIHPLVGERGSNGLEHISINEKTTFRLTAVGLFSQIEQELEAHPFPVPVITHLFSKSPAIEMNISIETPFQRMPENWISLEGLNINDAMRTDGLASKFELLDTNLLQTLSKHPKEKTRTDTFSFSTFYNNIIQELKNQKTP